MSRITKIFGEGKIELNLDGSIYLLVKEKSTKQAKPQTVLEIGPFLHGVNFIIAFSAS